MNARKRYHHGDLRNTLIEMATEMLVTDGVAALSLRKVAKRAGVSHNAPYMHFADKEGLLAAIAEEGFRRLTAAVDQAVAEAGDGWYARFQAGCCAYVQFALEHAEHLQVMIGSFAPAKYPSLATASWEALERLKLLIEAGQAAGQLRAGDSREMATVAWSLVHGIATIWAGGKMPAVVIGEREAPALTADFVGMLYGGLAA